MFFQFQKLRHSQDLIQRSKSKEEYGVTGLKKMRYSKRIVPCLPYHFFKCHPHIFPTQWERNKVLICFLYIFSHHLIFYHLKPIKMFLIYYFFKVLFRIKSNQTKRHRFTKTWKYEGHPTPYTLHPTPYRKQTNLWCLTQFYLHRLKIKRNYIYDLYLNMS